MGSWKYEVIHDYNATQLIKEFREENLKLKNSKGSDDDEIDFIVYAEKDDFTISLGRVLLIKMSDAMVKYYYEYKGTKELTSYWAKYVYEQHKNNKTFQFQENEIEDAFLESIKLQTNLVSSITVLDIENFAKKLSETVSTFLHKDLKFSREQWDPTLKSDKYLFSKPQNAVNYFVSKCNDTIKELIQIKAKLLLFKSFSVAGFKIDTPFIESLIKTIDNQIDNITKFKKWLIENKNDIQLKIPYLCGIWNGLIEFVAGIADVILLAINILINEILEDSKNLELLEVRESVEEALSKLINAIKENPSIIIDEIINAVKQYRYSRYDDKSLTKYQIQFHDGEDTILTIDIIVTIVTIVKALAKLSKLLPKFTKWIDDVLKRGGNGALKIEEALQEAKRAKKLIGVIEYEILSENLLKKYVDDVLKICKEKGIKLEIKWIDETHPEFGNSSLLGKLEVTLDKRKLFLHIRPECPKITWFHEKRHLDDFLEMGWRKYTGISKKTPWKHEESVWNFIYKNRNKWSEPELADAYLYFQDYIRRKSLYKLDYFMKDMEEIVPKYKSK
jgi:hypothetical protein